MGNDYQEDADGILLISQILGIAPHPLFRTTDLEIQAVERELAVRLPPSYQLFLRAFGAKIPGRLGLLGLPRGRLCGDLVLRNLLDPTSRPRGFVKFMENDTDSQCYLATPLANRDGECPIVQLDMNRGNQIAAHSFLDFLKQLGSERQRRSLAGRLG